MPIRYPAYASLFVLAVAVACSSEDGAIPAGSGRPTGTAGEGGGAGSSSTPLAGADTGGSDASAGHGGAAGTPEGGASEAGTGAVAGGEGGSTSGGAAGGDGGATASGGYCAGKAAVSLPMVVSDNFKPTGYLGGDGTDVSQIADACPSRPASPSGACFTFEWTAAASTFGGVVFQYPDGNWGAKPGRCVQDGAKVVYAKVRGAVGGEKVDLVGPGEVHAGAVTLTTDWQELQVSLAGVDYNGLGPLGGVINAVELVFTDKAAGKQRVYMDDIRWE